MSGSGYSVAIIGATGAVGGVLRSILEERDFPVASLKLLASSRSAGKTLTFRGKPIVVEELTEDSFEGVDYVLSSAGGGISERFLPAAVKAGAVCIDNTSAFRMREDVPLVVPEVNAHAALKHNGIIAVPNCSTIQMVVVLKPLHDAARLKRVIVSTYQGIAGAGVTAMEEANKQIRAVLEGEDPHDSEKFVHPIAFNCLPQRSHGVGSDPFDEDGYSDEEAKMTAETVKIMGDDSVRVTATCVRVPVLVGHSESINIETEKALTPDEAREILARAPGVTVVDNPAKSQYPLAIHAAGKDDTFVGRIRKDLSTDNALNMWVVSDNLRKGAALNAVQIAELLIDA